ncbi:hypothetical protein ACIHEI_36685 [Kitasatospora sp. NPDC051984]|uniref:hypothetical protein n=1 Tax=Kitasatospora sp. NPDC051984 TaxID=3364059 RepID=UPI0037C91EF1
MNDSGRHGGRRIQASVAALAEEQNCAPRAHQERAGTWLVSWLDGLPVATVTARLLADVPGLAADRLRCTREYSAHAVVLGALRAAAARPADAAANGSRLIEQAWAALSDVADPWTGATAQERALVKELLAGDGGQTDVDAALAALARRGVRHVAQPVQHAQREARHPVQQPDTVQRAVPAARRAAPSHPAPTMTIMGTDARGIEEETGGSDGPGCKVCGTPIRGDGPGQRPAYCGRACSSKAYRARTKDKQAAALTATNLDDSREPLDSEATQQIAALGALVDRAARGLAETLDKGVGTDISPITARMLLRLPLSGLERAAEELLARARTAVRQAQADYERELDASREAPSPTARTPVQGAERAPAEAVSPPARAAAAVVPPRPLDASRDASRGERDASRDASRPELHASRNASPERVEASRDASPAPAPTAPDAQPDPLDLLPPDRRGLGPTAYSSVLPEIGPGWEVRGWTGRDHLCLVVRDDRAVGWAEDRLGGADGWVAFVGLGDPPVYLVDAQDRPVRHATARSAARSVSLALRQNPDLDPA